MIFHCFIQLFPIDQQDSWSTASMNHGVNSFSDIFLFGSSYAQMASGARKRDVPG